MKRLVLAAACGLLMIGAARADEASDRGLSECIHWSQLEAAAAHKAGYKIVKLTPGQTIAMTANINNAPPVSAYVFSAIYTIQHGQDEPLLVSLIDERGCIGIALQLNAEELANLLKPGFVPTPKD